ncbi:GntR family transcriptional regulator [Microbaculum marinum]|uniref:GntR family transcriptional regulator n=1 Tax=Microbaculum marinum TaxID=1764581 RepID=A0AAW9RVH4_9HYPH
MASSRTIEPDGQADPDPRSRTVRRREAADRDFSGPAPRLYERVFRILAGQIEAGEIAGGARLGETAVAERFGISRAPARQALEELERGGLVVKSAGRGYTVNSEDSVRRDPIRPASADSADVRLVSMSSWERIYGEIENEITARISFASWRLNEVKLARHYGVSRTVARDVIGRLQQRGVIRKDERSRWYAPRMSPDHIGELYELRWLLEPQALVKAAPDVPPALIARMRRNLEDAIAEAHTIGGATLDRLEEELHVELLGYCGNGTLMQAITLHQSLLIAHRFLYRWTPRLFETEPFLPEHLAIVEQLECGRATASARTLEQHLRVSRDRAIARVDVVVQQVNPEDLAYLEPL